MSLEEIWQKNYPSQVPRELDFDKTTMPQALARSAQKYAENIALIFMGKKISYATLDRTVNRFAKALRDLGVKKGDTVALVLPNIPQVVIANYATWRIGAVAALNNPLYTERELQYQLDDSDATIVITLDLLLPRILNIKPNTKIRHIITCHISDYLPIPLKQLFPYVRKNMYRKVKPSSDVNQFLDLMKQYDDTPVKDESSWDDVATLLYTGGTTGTSKGVMLTHANMSCNVQQLRSWFYDLKEGEGSMMGIFPFFHSAGFTGIQNMTIWGGWTDILIPRPEPGVIIEQIKKI